MEDMHCRGFPNSQRTSPRIPKGLLRESLNSSEIQNFQRTPLLRIPKGLLFQFPWNLSKNSCRNSARIPMEFLWGCLWNFPKNSERTSLKIPEELLQVGIAIARGLSTSWFLLRPLTGLLPSLQVLLPSFSLLRLPSSPFFHPSSSPLL